MYEIEAWQLIFTGATSLQHRLDKFSKGEFEIGNKLSDSLDLVEIFDSGKQIRLEEKCDFEKGFAIAILGERPWFLWIKGYPSEYYYDLISKGDKPRQS
jgi:hypothetical protein